MNTLSLVERRAFNSNDDRAVCLQIVRDGNRACAGAKALPARPAVEPRLTWDYGAADLFLGDAVPGSFSIKEGEGLVGAPEDASEMLFRAVLTNLRL